MIYCVVPAELESELYDRLVRHYEDDPNVKVIVDRRLAERRAGHPPGEAGQRIVRDRRRSRVAGEFPRTDPPV